LILDSRIHSTRVLGEAVARCENPPSVWLNSSTATIYKHNFGPAWDESGEIGGCAEAKDVFSVYVATEWEREFFHPGSNRREEVRTSKSAIRNPQSAIEHSLLTSAATGKVRKVALRSAMVLGRAKNSVLPNLLRLARFGLGGRMASGRQFASWMHYEDFCHAAEWIIEHDSISGPVNLAAPNPVTNAELMAAVRKVCRVRFGFPSPRWLLEIGAFLMRTETELIIKSRRVMPGQLLASGFEFRHPQLLPAIEELVSQNRCANDRVKPPL
jgi:NAD dependent epimerase/dehydratase family enzyme